MAKQKHFIAVETEAEEVNVSVTNSGWWFKVFHSWVDNGWWGYMGDAARNVLIVLAKHANTERLCWPGMTTLTIECRIQKSAIYAALNRLEAYGLMERLSRGYGTKKTIYQIKESTKRAPDGVYSEAGSINIPEKQPVSNERPVSQHGKSVKHSGGEAGISGRAESIPLIRNRSVQEHKNRISELAPGEEQEPKRSASDDPIDSMSDAELHEAKEMAVAIADESLQPFLAKADPRTSKILRARIIALMNP